MNTILLYIIGGLLAILIGLGVYTHGVKQSRDSYKAAVTTYKEAQRTNLETIGQLQSDFAMFKTRNEADLAQSKKDGIDAQKSIDANNHKADSSQAKREIYYASQPATACINQLVPAAVLDGLR